MKERHRKSATEMDFCCVALQHRSSIGIDMRNMRPLVEEPFAEKMQVEGGGLVE